MFEVLKEILISKLKVTGDQVTPEASREDVELDSLAIVELSMLLEKDYGIEISDDELMDVDTIGEMARLMEERRATV
ncbi:acyl carrier protein [Streptomyces hypolithicus]